jgi:hypothetical protein
MALTMWSNTITDERLDEQELERFQRRAHRLYEANVHIFEDELDALAALGVVPAAGRPLGLAAA